MEEEVVRREHLFWIGLKKGENVVVFAKGTTPELIVQPEAEDKERSHAWGLHLRDC